jgi:hypothetical protein
MIQELFSAECDVNARIEGGDANVLKGWSPLSLSIVYGGEASGVDSLLSGRANMGRSSLQFAALTGRLAIVALLLDRRANIEQETR